MGVKEWGNRPNRLVDPINKMREVNISDQVRPLMLCIDIICFKTNLTNHC